MRDDGGSEGRKKIEAVLRMCARRKRQLSSATRRQASDILQINPAPLCMRTHHLSSIWRSYLALHDSRAGVYGVRSLLEASSLFLVEARPR